MPQDVHRDIRLDVCGILGPNTYSLAFSFLRRAGEGEAAQTSKNGQEQFASNSKAGPKVSHKLRTNLKVAEDKVDSPKTPFWTTAFLNDAWVESTGCLIKGCLNSTEIPKVGIPKPGIPKSGIPKTGIPKAGIPKVAKNPHWDSSRDRDSQSLGSEVRDSENRDSESRDSEARDSENGQIHGPFNSDTPYTPSETP